MIWGAIFGVGYSDFYQINHDPFSARQGFSSQSYLETLEENLPQFFMNSGRIFMHDNAPIHTARVIKAWLWENAIPITSWPPYSPDLNPIEHAWAKLKEMVDRLDPVLDKVEGTKEQLVTHFQELIHVVVNTTMGKSGRRIVMLIKLEMQGVIYPAKTI
ncbi:hypothetical protein VN97_g9908 [Penicillium thymicola]|uniref:Tc1-like transposase DDE domain-containing protein n=1 Tax=Penicillium thymicola TaxID=293382 RepID=A0AAI9X4V3_PENTH|nr:hypothetical protein VN97_g9908 [Penicillium thymicola]